LHDPDARDVQLEDTGQLALQVVRHLRGRPHGEQPIRVHVPDRAVRLDRGVRGTVEEILAFHDNVCLVHQLVDRPELQLDALRDVAVAALAFRLVDRDGCRLGCQGLLRIEVERQHLVLDRDRLQRRVRRLFIYRRHARHGVPDVPDLVHGQSVLIARPRDDPVRRRHVVSRDHRMDTRYLCRALSVERHYACMRVRTSQKLGV
jgi:hypothetical protein